LVDVDGDRRAPLELCAAAVALAERLLDVLDAERGELADGVECLVDGPPLVDVDRQREIGHRPNGADALYVEPVAAAELELEPPEARRGVRRAARHVVRVAEPHRPRRRRADARNPENPVDGRSEQLALQVVQRRVERAFRRLLASDLPESRADLLE